MYLQAIDSKLWVTAFYPSPYYDHKISNVVEQGVQRSVRVTNLRPLDVIWHYTMDYRFKRCIKGTMPGP